MKKLSLILVAAMTLCAGVNKTLAQSNAPRFGTALGQDNTFRPLTLGVKELADTAGSTIDTVTFVTSLSQRGSIFDMNVKLTLTDSCVLAISSDGSSRYGDRMHLIIANTSGANHKVKFLGYSGLTSQWLMNAASGTTITLNSGATTFVEFYYDGQVWEEVSRNIH